MFFCKLKMRNILVNMGEDLQPFVNQLNSHTQQQIHGTKYM